MHTETSEQRRQLAHAIRRANDLISAYVETSEEIRRICARLNALAHVDVSDVQDLEALLGLRDDRSTE